VISKLFLDTPIANQIWRLFREIEDEMQLRAPLNMYTAGEAAMHLYDGVRAPMNVDAVLDVSSSRRMAFTGPSNAPRSLWPLRMTGSGRCASW
jgi:hypothetical protein